MWYYSDKDRQKGPVPFDELRRLAHAGYLKPSDLVWQEGAPDWVRASLVDGLFDSSLPPSRGGAGSGAEPPPARADYDDRPRRGPDYDDRPRRGDYDDRRRPDRDGDRPRGGFDRPRRQDYREEGMSTGLKVGLIVGGIVLLLIIVAIILIVVLSGGSSGSRNYTLSLMPGQMDSKPYDFRAGQSVEVHVFSNPMGGGGMANVTVNVVDSMGIPVVSDFFGRNESRLRFTVRSTGRHRIEVTNVGGSRTSSSVSVRY